MESVIPNPANLALFVSAALVLLVIPGPSVLYIVAQSIEQDRRAGLVSDLSIHTSDAGARGGRRAGLVGPAGVLRPPR